MALLALCDFIRQTPQARENFARYCAGLEVSDPRTRPIVETMRMAMDESAVLERKRG